MTVRQVVGGFEGGTAEQWGTTAITGTGSVVSGAARTGGYGLKLNPTAGAASLSRQYSAVPLSSIVGRVYFRYESSLPGGDCHLMTWGGGGTTKYRLIFQNSTSKVRLEHVTSGVQDVVQDGPVIAGATWYCLDWAIGRAGAKQMEWKIDAVAQSTVGPNAAYQSGLAFWVLGNDTGSQTYVANYDDSISLDGVNDGTDNNAVDAAYPLGAGYVKRLVTSGVGTHNNSGDFAVSSGTIAASYLLLDQLPMLATTDWVSQTVLNTASYLEYTHDDLATDEVPNGVNFWLGWNNDFFNPANIKLHAIESGTDHTLLNLSAGDFVPHAYSASVPLWPWTRDKVNALLTRLGYSGDVTPNPKVNSLFIECDVKVQTEPEGWPDAYIDILAL